MESWARVAVILALFGWLFRHNFVRLWLKTNPFNGEPNWSHSIFVPIIGLYYLFVHREDLAKARPTQFVWGPILRPARTYVAAGMLVFGGLLYIACKGRTGLVFTSLSPAGLALAVYGVLVFLLDWSIATMLFGLGVVFYGIYPGQNDYLKDLGMVIMLFGIVLMLNGWEVMKIAWFPIAFLICAIPWPGLVYSWVAEPLAQTAAHIGVIVLKLTGVEAVNEGTKIKIFGQIGLPPRILNVAEACAGMRSLMTFIALAGAIAFLPVKPLWQRLIIVASAVPIAIFCNMSRISVVGLLDHYVSTKWSDSFAHQFVGTVILFPAVILIYLVGSALEKIFIVEADDGPAPKPAMARSPIKAVSGPAVSSAVPASATLAPTAPRVAAVNAAVKPAPATVGKAPAVTAATPAATPPGNSPPRTTPPLTTLPRTTLPRTAPTAPPRSPAGSPVRPALPPMQTTPPRPVTAANPQPRSAPVKAPVPAPVPAHGAVPRPSPATAGVGRPPAAIPAAQARTTGIPPAIPPRPADKPVGKPVDPLAAKRPVTSPPQPVNSVAAAKAAVNSAAPKESL